ncbi:hypothetical protein HK102_009055 [Quaeritorhiza haematococci]|nr:hypothetical protein HK102_009055 [Quaeritorhiza haematococci]
MELGGGFEFGRHFLMDEDYLVCQRFAAHFDKAGLDVATTNEGNYMCGSDAGSLDEDQDEGEQVNVVRHQHQNVPQHSKSADVVQKIGAPAPDDVSEWNMCVDSEEKASDCREPASTSTGKDETQSVQLASSSSDTGLTDTTKADAPGVGAKEAQGGQSPVEQEPLPDFMLEHYRRINDPRLSFEERWNMDPVPRGPDGKKVYCYIGCTEAEWREQDNRLRKEAAEKKARKAMKATEKPVEEKKEMNHEQWVAMCRRIFPELRHY